MRAAAERCARGARRLAALAGAALAAAAAGALEIEPDLWGVTVPPNIAPLDFRVAGARGAVRAELAAADGSTLAARGGADGLVRWKPSAWRAFLAAHAGEDVVFAVEADGARRAATNTVARAPIDRYLAYRLIEPSYRHTGDMGLYERDLSTFAERPLYRTAQAARGQCVNCHTSNRGDPEEYLFHSRIVQPGTAVVSRKWGARMADLALPDSTASCAYPAWHPSGDFIAFTLNETRQAFYAAGGDDIEVFDLSGGLALYSLADGSLARVPDDGGCAEAFPEWSPDGATLYTVRAKLPYAPPPAAEARFRAALKATREFRYVLAARDFDAARRTFSAPRVVYDGGPGRSVTLPRVSRDGRWVVLAAGPFGVFHVWHGAADLLLLDLRTGAARPLDELNSAQAESWHAFTRDGAWMVFGSRRGDGRYTRPYFTRFDASRGAFAKPFPLPAEDPEEHARRLLSYNVPEFRTGPVKETPREIRALLSSGARPRAAR